MSMCFIYIGKLKIKTSGIRLPDNYM